jgi:DNA repair photolyase
MIRLFSGEFLYHPVPLELSMNVCGHGCIYCFATLRNNKRVFEAKQFAGQMKKFYESDTFLGKKMREGWGCCISNNTDPFASNNARITEAILPQIIDKKIGIFIQTKGGKRLKELCEDLPISDFYWSMTMLNEDIRKKVEPGAPSIEERFEQMKWLIDKGHNVSIGLNPLVEEWMPEADVDEMIRRGKKIGIKSFVVQPMHFGRKNKEHLEKKDFAGATLNNYFGFTKKVMVYYQKILSKHHTNNTIAFNQPFYSKGIEYNGAAQKRKMLTAQHFLNYVFEKYGTNDAEIRFEEFLGFFNDGFIEDYSAQRYDEYVLLKYPKAWMGKPLNQNIHTKEHLFKVIWNEESVHINLQNNILFTKAGKDKDGNVIMKWNGGSIIVNGEKRSLVTD